MVSFYFMVNGSFFVFFSHEPSPLDVGWVQHDSHGSTEGLWRQVLLEVGSDNTVVTVGSGDLTPDDSDLGTSDFLVASVNVGNLLTQVEFGVLRRVHTVDLDQRGVWVDQVLGTLVGQVLTLNVQSVRFGHFRLMLSSFAGLTRRKRFFRKIFFFFLVLAHSALPHSWIFHETADTLCSLVRQASTFREFTTNDCTLIYHH